MKYAYYVRYTVRGGSGNCQAFLPEEITRFEQVQALMTWIGEKTGHGEVVIDWFVRLPGDDIRASAGSNATGA